ncbi:MAG: hypothetical protein K2Q34_07645 [Alphaproteobacteria bacterium]|nr:hypothetical protein [Alphaproteobacteria bacterium]
MRALGDGHLSILASLPEAAGLDFDDAEEFKNPQNATLLLNALIASLNSMRELTYENAALKNELSKVSGRVFFNEIDREPSSVTVPVYPELKPRLQQKLAEGSGTYDPLTGVFTYSTGITEQVKLGK